MPRKINNYKKGGVKMKTGIFFRDIIVIGIAIIFAATLFATPSLAAKPKIYKMEGKISAIDLQYNTVVIQVPLTKKNVFTVGGPLAKDAVLKRGNKKDVSLKNFKVGDTVIVEWEPTSQGHVIKLLKSK